MRIPPAVAKLKLTRPDIFAELSDEEFVSLLQRKVDEREAEIRQHAKANGSRFLGVRRILRQRQDRGGSGHYESTPVRDRDRGSAGGIAEQPRCGIAGSQDR